MASTDLLVWAVIGLLAGVWLFIQGFIWLRQKRMIENIPTSKIRSLAMGLVEIKAKAFKPLKQFLISPFQGKKCLWYKYTIEEYHKTEDSDYWKTIKMGEERIPFYVKDNTGTVLVDPKGARIELPIDYEHRSGFRREAPKRIATFCQKQNVKTKGWFFNKTLRYREYILQPNDQLYIIGTAGDNPYVEDATGQKNEDDIMIQKGENEKFYYISDQPEEDILSRLKWKVVGGLFGGAALMVIGLAYILFRAGLF